MKAWVDIGYNGQSTWACSDGDDDNNKEMKMMSSLTKNWSCNTNTELPESECSAAASRKPFCSQEELESCLGLLSDTELSLGLKSLGLPFWKQPWKCTQPELPARPSSPGNMLRLWPSPLSNALDTLQGFPSQNSLGGGDLLDYFPSLTRMTESLSLLNSESSSPVDSEASAISSGSDHLTSSRIPPPKKFDLFDTQKEVLLPSTWQQEDSISPLTSASPAVLKESLAKCWTRTAPWPGWNTRTAREHSLSIEMKAQLHRHAAATTEATCSWVGQLPPRIYKSPVYSCKVFLGGVPWDVTERSLLNTFNVFGALKVEWPDKDGKHSQCPPQGYVYLVFELEKSVKALLQACSQRHLHLTDYLEYYYKISSKKIRCKVVQVIPWVITDSSFVCSPLLRFLPSRTVFVGALHGMLTAGDLAHIMKELFGEVVYAGLDTDKHKYPIGSGRVTFRNQNSYVKALTAAFVEIKTTKFTKKVQIDPYLDDSMCQICNCQPGPFFCRDQGNAQWPMLIHEAAGHQTPGTVKMIFLPPGTPVLTLHFDPSLACFQYYCRSCWHWHHSADMLSNHRPLMRNQKSLNPN